MILRILSRVRAFTRSGDIRARDTVDVETRALRATSLIVAETGRLEDLEPLGVRGAEVLFTGMPIDWMQGMLMRVEQVH